MFYINLFIRKIEDNLCLLFLKDYRKQDKVAAEIAARYNMSKAYKMARKCGSPPWNHWMSLPPYRRNLPPVSRLMNVIVMIAASLLPAVVLLLYIWMKDTQKEPTYMLLKAVAWGIGIVIPVVVVETMIKMMLFGQGGSPTTLADTTALAFLVAAIPEETFKLLALWMVLKKNPYFDEHFDGIVYAVCVGLGFAAVENVSYVFSQENWAAVAVTRALLAVPGHYAFAVLMGYYYSVYHFVNRSPKVAVCVLLAPVLAHGIYDALAMSSMVNPYVGGVGFAILIVFCIKMHKRAYAKVQALVREN